MIWHEKHKLIFSLDCSSTAYFRTLSLPRGLFCIISGHILQDNLRKRSLIKDERKIQQDEGVKMSAVKKKN